ncbi:MAG: PAS domain-containing protein [Pseudomonadota bacterium]
MSSKDNQDPGKVDNDLALAVLEQIPTPVMVVDKDFKITFMNDAGRKFLGKPWDKIAGQNCYNLLNSTHCRTPECRMRQAMETGERRTSRNELNLDGQITPIEYTAAPLKDENGQVIGGLEYVIDITERVRHEQKLREQSRTIQEISTPAIKLWDRIVVLPVVGVVDSLRAQQMMNAMLNKITETSAKVIIMDIQGVAAVDTAVANHLIKITKATKLMGCRCIISGISSAVAQTLVQLGINLGEVTTNSTLEDALADAFNFMNYEVRKK